mgnify:FL=1
MTAWLEYDLETLVIKKVSWKKSNIVSIEIDDNLAEDFILGNKSLESYCIVIDADKTVLSLKPTTNIRISNASQLSYLDSNNQSAKISIIDNSIKIYNIPDLQNTLFVTKKDDPSWLVASIDLSLLKMQNNGIVEIAFINATTYSYFLGR